MIINPASGKKVVILSLQRFGQKNAEGIFNLENLKGLEAGDYIKSYLNPNLAILRGGFSYNGSVGLLEREKKLSWLISLRTYY